MYNVNPGPELNSSTWNSSVMTLEWTNYCTSTRISRPLVENVYQFTKNKAINLQVCAVLQWIVFYLCVKIIRFWSFTLNMFRFYVLVLDFKLFTQVKGCHNQDRLCNVAYISWKLLHCVWIPLIWIFYIFRHSSKCIIHN